MTNLSDLFPAGAGKQVAFTASGNISASGKPLILNSDGTVTQVAGTATSSNDSTVITSVGATGCRLCYDTTNDKYIWFGAGTSGYTTAKVGTYDSGTGTMSWGTAYVLQSYASWYHSIAFNENDGKFIAQWYANNIPLGAYAGNNLVVGTVTGTSISYGTPEYQADVSAGYSPCLLNNNWLIYYAAVSKVVWVWADSSYGLATILNISGTSVSLGNTIAFSGGSGYITSESIGAVYAHGAEDSVCVFYGAGGATDTGTAVAMYSTDGGVNLSLGSTTVFDSNSTSGHSGRVAVFDEDTDQSIFYYAASGGGYAVVGSTSSYNITTTARVQFSTDAAQYFGGDWDADANKGLIVWRSATSAYPSVAKEVTLSGSTLSFGTEFEFATEASGHKAVVYDPDNTILVGVNTNGTTSVIATKYSFGNTNLTSTNFIGVSDAAISSAASGNITMKGGIAATGLSSLTPGTDYYVQVDGTFGTSAGDPSVKAGKALSATAINLEYQS